MFWVEATKYQVLPLDASALTRFIAAAAQHRRPGATSSPTPSRSSACRSATAPSILNRSFTITAEIEVPQGGGNGMLVTAAGVSADGASICSRASRCSSTTCWTSRGRGSRAAAALTPGKHTVEFAFKSDGPGLGKSVGDEAQSRSNPGDCGRKASRGPVGAKVLD